MKNSLLLALFSFLASFPLSEVYGQKGELRAEVDALAFFRDNEYSSRIMKGYTLPGGWLQPKLTYDPLPQVHLEAGAHLMFYDGANRYPCYAYHDIVKWKGNQHTHGVHALPFFRAQAKFKHLSIVLGDIYGATDHQLILPLFNPEQLLSTDPEMGFQLLLDRTHVHLDTWINWQSYIFDLDSHQEAFTVGINATPTFSRRQDIKWEFPIQVVAQHRGGEQDTTSLGVQTVCNGSVGVRMTYHRPGLKQKGSKEVLSTIHAEINALGSWQQHGTLWPFDTGFAVHASAGAVLFKTLDLEAGYVGAPRQFANLYGLPMFGTLSTKFPGITFRGMHTAYLHAGYSYAFTPDYSLGADLDIYSCNSHGLSATTFGFGLYFRATPSFLLHKKK